MFQDYVCKLYQELSKRRLWGSQTKGHQRAGCYFLLSVFILSYVPPPSPTWLEPAIQST